MKRFQECPWYIKLWRYRWYLAIPFMAFDMWVKNVLDQPFDEDLPFKNAWGIATGIVQMKMGWYYTSEEIKEKFDRLK